MSLRVRKSKYDGRVTVSFKKLVTFYAEDEPLLRLISKISRRIKPKMPFSKICIKALNLFVEEEMKTNPEEMEELIKEVLEEFEATEYLRRVEEAIQYRTLDDSEGNRNPNRKFNE